MTKYELLGTVRIEHHLIDRGLDLMPMWSAGHGAWGGGGGWRDKASGLGFELERELKAHEIAGHSLGFWHFHLWHPKCDKPLVAIHFPSDVLNGPIRTLRHRIDKSKAFEWSDMNHGGSMISDLIAELGGREKVFDICLKGIRACGCLPIRIETCNGVKLVKVVIKAAEIEFEIAE